MKKTDSLSKSSRVFDWRMKYRMGNSFLLMSTESNETPTNFTIVDKVGKKRYESNSPNSTYEISVANLEGGEYLLLVESEENKTTFRFFKD